MPRGLEVAALAMLAAACDGEMMAGLPKQVVNIPITGGLDTKTGPLAQVPGTFLQLDDVRQERRHEWRNRNGITHSDALDDLGSAPPIRSVELPGGGLLGLVVSGANFSAAATYSRNVPAGLARWQQTVGISSAITPTQWHRRPVATEAYPVYQTTVAVGNGLRFDAWKPGSTSVGQAPIRVTITSDTDGKTVLPPTAVGGTSGVAPRAVYHPGTNLFLLFWLEGANVVAASWNATTGVPFGAATTIKTTSDGAYIDALYYTGSNVNVVYTSTTGPGNIRFLSVNPTTFALTVDLDLGVNAGNALSLFPDPDGSGLIFIGAITATPQVRVLRVNSLGAIQNNDLVDAAGGNQIIGCAYQSGAGWLVVWNSTSGAVPTIKAAKKRSGVVSSPVSIAGGYTGSPYYLDSGAWREPGTDPMRYIMGIHVGDNFATEGDFQHSYLEMAIEYENASSSVTNSFTEPQARLIPLNAGPGVVPTWGPKNTPAQVVRTATNKFAASLVRLAAPVIAAGVRADTYAIDAWDQTILSTAIYTGSHPNLGQGAIGPSASYLPAGLLLQSVNGALICGHGGSALPFRPTTSLAASGTGPTVGQAYQYLGSIEYPEETGDVWRSARSVASAPITPTAGNQRIDVVWHLPTLEQASRVRIAKLWRTLGNGSTADAQLVYQTTILSNQATVTFADTVPDTTLALSNFLPIGLPASITPAFNHIAFFDGRMFGAERDFPSRIRFTHRFQTGISPEFPVEFFVDIEDEYGDITGVYSLDDKLIVTKENAIYFCPQSGGPAVDGSGGTYTFTRLNAEIGHQSGTPAISTGSNVYFFHDGMYSIDRSLHITEHDAIERYFNYPLLATPEVPTSITYNAKRDEIRLHTTNYRFVYDMDNQIWIRDTGAPAGAVYVQTLTDVGDMFFRSNGQVWWDYDIDTGTADASGTIRGVLRSPWIHAAQPEGYFRIYRERAMYKIEASGALTTWPETTIYFNNDDAIFATTTRTGTTGATKQTTEARNARGKVTSFSLAERLPAGNVTWRLNQWSVLLALKKAMHADAPVALGR